MKDEVKKQPVEEKKRTKGTGEPCECPVDQPGYRPDYDPSHDPVSGEGHGAEEDPFFDANPVDLRNDPKKPAPTCCCDPRTGGDRGGKK